MKTDALPSCFRDRASHTSSDMVSSSSNSKSVQSLVTCFYRTTFAGQSHLVSITWSKGLTGQGLSVSFDDPACIHRCTVDMKPWRFWQKQGSKSLEMDTKKLDIFWDLSSAKYTYGPEPQEAFYVAIACDHEVIFLLGDMQKEALKKFHGQSPPLGATLLSRREHVYGKQLYTTKAQLCESGRAHDIAIECHVGAENNMPQLSVRVDRKTVIHVTSLMWKFRGNQTIQIDGRIVEVFWDVHNWLFQAEDGHAVFLFNTYVAHEKLQLSQAGVPATKGHHAALTNAEKPHAVSDVLWASVLQWSTSIDSHKKEQGFSLLLYAWNE